MSKRILTRGQLTVTALYDGKDGAPGPEGPQGPQGEQGDTGDDGQDGLSCIVEQPLVFDTDDTGVVPASELQAKVGKVRVICGANRSGQCSILSIESAQGCSASVSKASDGSGAYLRVQVTAVNTISTDGTTISVSQGYVVLSFHLFGRIYRTQVPFSVNISQYVGSVAATSRGLQSQFAELATDLSSAQPSTLTRYTTALKQSARAIAIEASQATVGRRNLLVGSDFSHPVAVDYTSSKSNLYATSAAQGKDGHIAFMASTAGDGITEYKGLFWNEKVGSIPVKRNTRYTFSVWVKCDNTQAEIHSELYYRASATSPKRIDGPAPVDEQGNWRGIVKVAKAGTYELYTYHFDTGATYDFMELNIFVYSGSDGKTAATAYFCTPMLEEGDSYTGWTLSTRDHDYVGGNMLDDTRTLVATTQQSNLVTATDVDAGVYEGTYAVAHGKADDSNGNMDDFLRFSSEGGRSLSFVRGDDYVFSFLARGTGQLNAYLYNNNHQNVYTELSDGTEWPTHSDDGAAFFTLTTYWRRYWVHWRIDAYTGEGDEALPMHVLLRAISGCEAWVTQPKLERGSAMTDYTEKHSDLIDRATAKSAGLEITPSGVTLYGEKIRVKNTLSSGLVLDNALFEDGRINARFILAQMLQTEGLQGRKITIGDGLMNVYGSRGTANIRFGLNSAGQAVLSYYDDNGNFLYDLGPSGIATMDKTNGSITSAIYYKAESVGLTTPIGENVDLTWRSGTRTWYTATLHNEGILFDNRNTWTGSTGAVTLYTYTAPRVNNKVVADPTNGLTTQQLAAAADGKTFTSRTMVVNGALTNFANGVYIKQGAKINNMTKRIPALDKGDMAVIPTSSFLLYSLSSLGFSLLTVYSRSTETYIGTLDIGLLD